MNDDKHTNSVLDHLLDEHAVAERQGRSVKTLRNQRVAGDGIPLPQARSPGAVSPQRCRRVGTGLSAQQHERSGGRPMTRLLSYDLSPELLAELERQEVRYLPTVETLQLKQTRMLAGFQRGGVPRRRWRQLMACNGCGCPNPVCSAACWFGERAAVLKLVAQAHDLFVETGLPLWFATVIDPRYATPLGALKSLSLDGMQQGLRRRLRRVEETWGPTYAFGACEVSLEIERDGASYWGPHTHCVIATRCPKAEMSPILMPAGDLPARARPVVLKRVTNLGNALGYCDKREPAERIAIVGSRGTQDRNKWPVNRQAGLEHDTWLLGLRPTERLILRGFRRVHDRLVLLR